MLQSRDAELAVWGPRYGKSSHDYFSLHQTSLVRYYVAKGLKAYLILRKEIFLILSTE